MTKIGVYGATGFIGQAIWIYLSDCPTFDVYPIGRSGIALPNTDVIINCAGNSKKFWAKYNMVEDFRNTTDPVLKLISQNEFKKLIHISSVDAMNSIDRSIGPRIPYGISKAIADRLVMTYCRDKYLILRLPSVIGAGMKKGVLYDIIKGQKVFLHPDSKLQFITVTAVAWFIAYMLMTKFDVNNIIYLTGIDNIAVHEIGRMANKTINYAPEMELARQYYNVIPSTMQYDWEPYSSKVYVEKTLTLWNIFKGRIADERVE